MININLAIIRSSEAYLRFMKILLRSLYGSTHNVNLIIDTFSSPIEYMSCPKNFDVVILGYRFLKYKSTFNGLEIAKHTKQRSSNTRIILNTTFLKTEEHMQLLQCYRSFIDCHYDPDYDPEGYESGLIAKIGSIIKEVVAEKSSKTNLS